jgi:hypothetical protein
MSNRYQFETVLEGFINVYEDSGKFQNRTFAYTIPSDTLAQVEADRVELISWAKTKATGRVQEAITPWDDSGLCKYTYGAGDGSRKAKPEPVFVDSTGVPIERAVLRDVRKGTKVNIIVQQKPYAMGSNVGTSMKVIGVQIIELATGNGAVDSGDLSVEEVAGMFGAVKGFSQADPAVRQEAEPVAAGDSYDF